MTKKILNKAKELIDLNKEEICYLYNNTSLGELIEAANYLRYIHNPSKEVGYIIDRNVNITNICYSRCLFCNFWRDNKSSEAYVLNREDYCVKIEEMLSVGGSQLLLQGGMNGELGLEYYCDLFIFLKRRYPNLKLHALSPPEIVYLSKREKLSYREVLLKLIDSGLDSLPGGGAEILTDRVRRLISPAKCSTEEWLGVMKEAHILGLTTTATMVYGHIETIEDRAEHLIKIRDLQKEKPLASKGFIAFILWPFRGSGTRLMKLYPNMVESNSYEYVKMLTLSRIVLNNIKNIQVSWLTVGKDIASLTLQ